MPLGLTVLWTVAALAGQGQVVTSGPPVTRRTLEGVRPGAVAPTEVKPDVKPEDMCAIEGTVRNVATGEPVKNAELTLRRTDVRPDSGVPAMYSTNTDASGKFAMRNLEPGSYQLAVNRTGFAPLQYGAKRPQRNGTTLRLVARQRMTAVDFSLTPHAVIAGRVVDPEGDPLANVQVMALSYRYVNGRKQLAPTGGGSTNDLGEYRIFGLAPGRYYLRATHRTMSMATDRSVNPQDEDYVPTYYPGTTELKSAAVLDAGAGMEMQQTNMRLSKSRTVRVRGRVIDQTGPGGRIGSVNLVPKDMGMVMMGNRQSIVNGSEGRFELRGVAPGSYILTAQVQREQRTFTGRETIEVGDRDLEDVVVTVNPGIELHGEVRADEPGSLDLTLLRLMLRPSEQSGPYFGPMPNGTVSDNGTFVLSQTSPDRYMVSLAGLPDGYYLKSVRMEGADALEEGLDLTRGAAGLIRIVVSAKAGQLEGAVTNEKQEPVAGSTVVLIPTAPKRREQVQFHQTVTADQSGRFTLKNLSPGDYKLYAWEDVENGAWLDPEFLQPVESKGKAVTVREGSRETVDLKAIPVQ